MSRITETFEYYNIAVVANFNVEGIRESLEFWFRELNVEGRLLIAPSDQIIQQLLSPAGVVPTECGLTIVFIQTERWAPGGRYDRADLMRNFTDLINAMSATSLRSEARKLLVVFCPPSPELRFNPVILAVEKDVRDSLTLLYGVDCLDSRDLEELYPARQYEKYFDPFTDRLAQIPYTRLCYAALGTTVARKLYSLMTRPRKVIVMDCDNTLWSGVVAEVGPLNVSVGPGRAALQRFLIRQVESGRLICLCSKNEEEDVLAVFDLHPAMLLRREHLAEWKVNWNRKADNLRMLAADLNLALGSFVFIDDDSFECAQVRAVCPEVATLHLPSDELDIQKFLQNSWDLDLQPSTPEDRKRTLYYQQNAKRARSREEARSIEEFIADLELEIEIELLQDADLARASQLTVRTNQFNINGIRRSESELQAYLKDQNRVCQIVKARDRFGDYGTVGLMISHSHQDLLIVETLLLSCRALGKGIEQRMIAKLSDLAQLNGAGRIKLVYQPNARNTPLQTFLLGIGAQEAEGHWIVNVRDNNKES
ncbi:MAG TPA: HAD-IIIC family phosphatase [Blastocatellia bacterium]|nr:HAD-IIIC family phosphatase [Blastocatellia bacterium]